MSMVVQPILRILSFSAVAALLFASLAHAEPAPPKVLWLTDMDPETPAPANISSHDINSQTLSLLSPYMPDFEMLPKVFDTTRSLQLLKKRKNACIGKSVYNEERDSFSHYSHLPQVVFPPIRLYMRADHELAPLIERMLEKEPQLSLQQVMTLDPKLILGIARGRSYTQQLDEAIEAIQDSGQLWSRAVPDQSAGLFDMLMMQRLDMILLTSVPIQRFMQTSLSEQPLLAVPLNEATNYLAGYMACNDSPQGRSFIDSFNQAIRQVSQQRAYFDMHMSWVPVTEQPHFAALYNAAYGTNFKLQTND